MDVNWAAPQLSAAALISADCAEAELFGTNATKTAAAAAAIKDDFIMWISGVLSRDAIDDDDLLS
ncbi:hypothetical protein [Stenotrophomonas sp.]|uniref:hypothetical protein n=1 Tax=Stenotrophomonas sp. TaxID=69392 RepID=UPI0028AEA990|nr:hypothetical protein [Stenotrophomonas sp.]